MLSRDNAYLSSFSNCKVYSIYHSFFVLVFPAEYILSLGNLKWETFNNAITEKYCDLFWQDELLTGLYEAVNGTRPVIEKR